MPNGNTDVVMTTMLVYLASCSCSCFGLQWPPVDCTLFDTMTANGIRSVTVDCQLSNASESEQMGAIEAVLSQQVSATMTLSITNSRISKLPEQICRLSNLQVLILDRNQLTELPSDCLSRIPQLTTFSANENRIRHLQDGLFQGLRKLQELSISRNSIESIGLNLFSNPSDLPNLRTIDLSRNKLTVLGPWPFVRGQVTNGTVVVRLSGNSISRFTNEIGWSFVCGMKSFGLTLELGLNNISRLSDFTDAFNLTKLTNLICLYGPKLRSPMQIDLYKSKVICDCRLLKFVAIAKAHRYLRFLDNVHCSRPFELANQKVISAMTLPRRFVCDVTEMCPINSRCTQVSSELSLVVRASGLTELPASLPPLKTNKYKYVLNFTNSSIRVVDSRPYLRSTKSIRLSNSGVETITDQAWRDLTTVATIDLHGNRLRTLSPVIMDLDFAFRNLSLHGNQLSCDCQNAWLNRWLTKHKDRLTNPDGILCSSPRWLSGRVIFTVEAFEHCNDPNTAKVMAIGISSSVGVLGLLILLGFLVVHRLRIYLFATFNVHPFDLDECEGEEMDYDVFLTCSHEDRSHAFNVLEVLEQKKYKVCYHEKDFLVGQTIADNICQAVIRSKRVLCLVSERFLRSSYCIYEFETALDHSVKIKRKRVVVILLEDVDVHGPGVPSELGQYLSSHTVVEYWVSDWTKNLLYALPTRRMLRSSEEARQATVFELS